MLFTIDFSIPANTPKTSPTIKEIELFRGVIKRVSVLIPSGHFCLAHLQIWHGANPIMPHEAEQSIHGDNETFEFEPLYELEARPYKLTLLGWNEDEKFDHTFYLRFLILPREVVFPFLPIARLERITERVKRLKGKI